MMHQQQQQQQQQMAMMQQAQQHAHHQQQQQQQQQQMVANNQLLQQQQQQQMMQPVSPGMPQTVMGGQQFTQQQLYAGQVPQQVPMGMYMLQGSQYVAAGFPHAAVPRHNFNLPPAYTPQMAQQFKYKTEKLAARQAKQLEEQKRRLEAEHKARMFQDQQKRLKEFSAIGGRKMDADSLIKHIIGPDTKQTPRPPPPVQAVPTTQAPPVIDDDDGFGDFIQGPSTADFSGGQSVASAPQPLQAAMNKNVPIVPTTANPITDSASRNAPSLPHTPPAAHTPPMSHTPPASQTPLTTHCILATQPQTQQEKKDLEKMMFASCDLTAPQKARTFHKRILVKDAPKQTRQVTYQHSQKARVWSNKSEQLTDLFTLPAPEQPQLQPVTADLPDAQSQAQTPAGQGSTQAGSDVPVPHGLPAWCMGEVPLPDIYALVLQASTRDGQIQTDLVYAILVRSGLPREVLGAIWGMANTTKPGQLLPQELCAVLGLIAVAQNNMMPSIEVLHRLLGPPIPNLGQTLPAVGDPGGQQVPPTATPTPTPAVGAAATVTPGPAHGTVMPGESVLSVATPPLGEPEMEDFADFQDFQEAANGVQPSDSFGDFTAASPMSTSSPFPGPSGPSSTPGITPDTGTATNSAMTSLLPTERKPATGISVSIVSPDTLLGDEDKYSAFKHIADETVRTGTQSELFPTSNKTIETKDMPLPEKPSERAPLPDVAAFMGQPPAPANEPFADFTSATTNEGCTSVQANGSTDNMKGNVTIDKLSALKALVSDTKMYKEREEKPVTPKTTSPGEEEWAEFSSLREITSCTQQQQQLPAVPGDRYASLSSSAAFAPRETSVFRVKPTLKQKELFPADDSAEEGEEWGGFTESNTTSTNWADFSSPTVSHTTDLGSSIAANTSEHPNNNDWALSSSKNESDLTNFGTLKPVEPLKASSNVSDPSLGGMSSTKPFTTTEKKFNYFAHNLETMNNGGNHNIGAGTGMSALDLEPPDLPDMKDDDYNAEDFDKFGTFQAVDADNNSEHGAGLSSLGAPFGGMDDVGVAMSSAVDMFGYSSRPRTHHHPQKDTTDSVSISSNEFNGWKVPGSGKAAKESSDTNSVNSLDFATSIKQAKSPKDGSPAGGDSQSVSSLEFGGGVDRKSMTPADERSIASLELKIVSTPEDAPVDAMRPNQDDLPTTGGDTFGEFSSGTDGPKNGFKSNMLNIEYVQRPRAAHDVLQHGDMPSIVDRYSSLVQKQDEQDPHVTEWERCLDKCRGMLEQAANSFTTITDVALCDEVLHSRQGTQYIQGVIEIYRVACRITEAMRVVSITNEKLVGLLKTIDTAWLDLVTLLSDTRLKPSPGHLDFSGAVLRAEDERAQEKACGVCLLNVDWRGSQRSGGTIDHKLTYGGRQYHAACANFWVNCVDSMLPSLVIPELL